MLEGRDFEDKFDAAVAEIERKKKAASEFLTKAVKLLEEAGNAMIDAAKVIDAKETRDFFDRIVRTEIAVEDAGIELTSLIERMM